MIYPTEPWESWGVFAYNHVLTMPSGEHRVYYDCIEGNGQPPRMKELSSSGGGSSST